MIRFATEDDAGEIRRIYAPAVTAGESFELEVPSEGEVRQRMGMVMQQYPWLVDDQGGSLRGFSYATSHRSRAAYQWSVEVSVYVDANCRRQGCARSMYLRLFEILRDMQYYSAYAGIAVSNASSQSFHESLGFLRVGVFPRVGFKLGQWRDLGWWYLPLRNETDEAPQSPIPWSEWRSVDGRGS